jgi:predicted transcriptional regulator
MTLQQTSLEAFREVRRRLTQKQREVLAVFGRNPLTNKQVSEILRWPINCVTPRVLELRNEGLLKEDRKVYDQRTGRRMMAFKITFRRFGEQYN